MSKTNECINISDELAGIEAKITPEEQAFFDYADDVSNQIYDLMARNNITKAALAERMGTSKAFITKVLRGDANMTFKTLTKLLLCLKAKPVTKIVEDKEQFQWIGVAKRRGEVRRKHQKQCARLIHDDKFYFTEKNVIDAFGEKVSSAVA